MHDNSTRSGTRWSPAALAATIDHTLLKPDATRAAIEMLCDEALEHGFASVCVNSLWVPLVAARLAGSTVATCSVVGFPLGASLPPSVADEARRAIDGGADEIDMVMSIGEAVAGDWVAVAAGIARVQATCGGAVLKVILETCLLDDEQKRRACNICRDLGIDFVKTSTGFAGGGATLEDVRLMREAVGAGLGVKASGGIRDRGSAIAMLEAGATRLGCSASVAIVTQTTARDGTY